MPALKNPAKTSRHTKRPLILTPDRRLTFPDFVLLKASAGSGKTHALSLRFVQLLLSGELRKSTPNELRNILAITFTKNAAKEMKGRILDWLKECYFKDPEKSGEILDVVSIRKEQLAAEAEKAVAGILSRYTDFQVETIDSFMAAVFKASTVDLGFSPDFEIVLDNTDLISYAFQRYLRNVSSRSDEGRIFRTILDHLVGNLREGASFAWDPTPDVLNMLVQLYTKLATQNGELQIKNHEIRRAELHDRIAETAEGIAAQVERSGLDPDARGHFFSKILPAAREKRFSDLIGFSLKTVPVRKPKGGDASSAYEEILEMWERLQTLVDEYKSHYARDFFYPYLLAYQSLAGTLDQIKRRQGIVFIEDLNKLLAGYIDQGIIPDIYFRLGDRIHHYLIDEFQDTSPIQWTNIKPLIENSLAQAGSLFAVGDTKQAIYGFRDADYRIMKNLEDRGKEEFPSVEVQVGELKKNYRSHEAVLEFVKNIFLKRLNEKESFKEYRRIAERSGLNDFHQEVKDSYKGLGHVEYVLLEKRGAVAGDDENGGLEERATDDVPEKAEIQNRVQRLKGRGYSYSDIAILTYKNESVVGISSWLNEKNIPFIPYSSLDIRERKITGEILALLKFLDSPPDDLSFSIFLLSDVLRKKMDRDKAGLEGDGAYAESAEWRRFLVECRRGNDYPLYVSFRKNFPCLWSRYFERFFKTVGYYPLYDLATLVFRVFDVFELFPEEEAAATRLLEAIKDFEGMGKNDLREFLELTGDREKEASNWTIDVPSDIEAVRVMSIHKAKGLGFPVVILLLYGERFQPPDFYIDAAGGQIRVYKLTKDLAPADGELTRIYEDTKDREAVNRLNTLYVALTRARAELYVVGVKGKRDKYPFELVGEEGFVSADREPNACPAPRRPDSPRAEKLRFSGPFDLPHNQRESLNYESIRRGELAHAVLAEMETLRSGWDADIAEIIRGLRPRDVDTPIYEEIGRSIVRYFMDSPLQEYFVNRPGRRVLREFQFCDAGGCVYRMDRVVVDADSVAVIDYKTGAESDTRKSPARDQEDREQVRVYLRILKDIHPGKALRGILAYIDRKKWEAVE